MVAVVERVRARRSRLNFIFDRPGVLGELFLAPAVVYVLALVGVPFLLAVYYALSAYTIYNPSYHFVGLENFIEVMQSQIFRQTLLNTFVFTIGSLVLGLVLGKFGALLLLRPFPGRKLVRALLILPWAVPIALATVAWEWMFDSLYSVINWTLEAIGLVTPASAPQWLGDPTLAMVCVIMVNARGASSRLPSSSFSPASTGCRRTCSTRRRSTAPASRGATTRSLSRSSPRSLSLA
jgi:multiple sugar transport system permease protein